MLNQQITFPKRDQTIVFPLLEDTTNEEYAEAVGSIGPPSKVIFQSRMFKERMCFYFDTATTANNFMNDHGEIKIRDQSLQARYLINPLNN